MSEHLLVFRDRESAASVAEELSGEGFTEVRVVAAPLAGEGDGPPHEWAVYVRERNIADETGPVESGLRARFQALVEEHDGWYNPEPRLLHDESG